MPTLERSKRNVSNVVQYIHDEVNNAGIVYGIEIFKIRVG